MKKSVLFVCVHNAGRSQMAAALLKELGGDGVEVRSAGSNPATEVNPQAMAVLKEMDISIESQSPTRLTNEDVMMSDYVITMGCGDACSIYPGKKYLDWNLADPAGKSIEEVRRIRDEIELKVRELLKEISS